MDVERTVAASPLGPRDAAVTVAVLAEGDAAELPRAVEIFRGCGTDAEPAAAAAALCLAARDGSQDKSEDERERPHGHSLAEVGS